MKKSTTLLDDLIILVSMVGSLVCLNVLAIEHFTRVDLTADQAFTLSEASVTTMKELEDPVTVTAYFSGGLPQQFEQNRQYLEDLLEEYRNASGNMLSYEFVDPEGEETKEDRETKKEVKRDIFGRAVREMTSVEKNLEQLGIQPVEMRVIEDDERRTKRGYMGLVVRYQEETEVIPVVQDTFSIEYDLTTMIRRLTRIKVPVLGVLQGHGEPSLEEDLARLQPLLAQNYEVRAITLEDTPTVAIADDVDALLVAGTSQPYSDNQKKAIDQFIMSGKSAAFFLDLMDVDLQKFNPTPVEHGFGNLLAAYGAELGGDLVADVECSTLSIQERRGFMVVNMPVRYPFIPQLKYLDPESVVTRGITDVPLPFVAPLFLKEDIEGVTVTSLAKSSEKSWLEPAEAMKLDPRRDWAKEDVMTTGPYHLIASIEGKIKSAYGEASEGSTEGGLLGEAKDGARVIVAGTSGPFQEAFLGPSTAALILNTVDWMLLDQGLLKMRNRGVSEPPINPELEPERKDVIKAGLFATPLALLLLLGFGLRMKRNGRRRGLMPA
jgi:gliding-associated putative ABC transporter substrate-binding component GldG